MYTLYTTHVFSGYPSCIPKRNVVETPRRVTTVALVFGIVTADVLVLVIVAIDVFVVIIGISFSIIMTIIIIFVIVIIVIVIIIIITTSIF